MPVIELAGVSGVGKSTVAAELLKLPGFYEVPKIPGNLMREALWLIRSSHDAEIQAFADLIGPNWSFALRSLARLALGRETPEENEWGVIDGGLVRRGHNIADHCPDVSIDQYYGLMPAADLTVILSAPQELIEQRNRDRGHGDRAESVGHFLEIEKRAAQLLVQRGLLVAVLPATWPPATNAEYIKTLTEGAPHALEAPLLDQQAS